MAQSPQPKEYWSSRLGVILAVAGSAVGLGNFLRFPGQVVTYGGGAFMIPYLLSLIFVAIPIASSEWALGRYGGRCGYHSPLGIYYAVGGKKKRWGVAGGLAALAPFVINMYYIFVEAWCLVYALQYLGGLLQSSGLGFSLFTNEAPGLHLGSSDAYSNLFGSFVGISEDGSLFKTGVTPLIWATVFCVILNFTMIYIGVSKGIERFCKFAAPLILLCSLLVIARVVTLGNPTGLEGQSFLDGLGFMWNPTRDVVDPATGVVVHKGVWDALRNPETWLAATSQIFWSVSICLGAISSYASYIKPDQDVALSSVTATATNEFCEVVLGGLMAIPPAIMFLGTQAADKFTSSFSMGFVVLPNVFGVMPAGQLVGFLFFSLLFFAAVTSSMSLVQPTVALFQEAFRWTRRNSVLLAGLVNVVGTSIVCWYTYNLVALDSFDFWLANFAPFMFAIIQTTLVVFVWKLPNLQTELDRGARVKLPRFMGKLIKYVSLPYLALVFAFWCATNLGDRMRSIGESNVAQIALAFIVFLFVALALLGYLVVRRWQTEEKNEKKIGEKIEEKFGDAQSPIETNDKI